MKAHRYTPKTPEAFAISIYLRHLDSNGNPIFSRQQLSTMSFSMLKLLYDDLHPSQTQQEKYERRLSIRKDIKKKPSQRE